MNKKNYLQEMYPYDPGNRTFTIPVSIEHYGEIYNHFDPSPIPLRDLTPDLVEYLNQCSAEIPNRYQVLINLGISMEGRDAHCEKDCQNSLQTYFKHETLREKVEIKRRLSAATKYLAIACLCLAGYFVIDLIGATTFFLNLIQEAVLIGGWLFMWEAITVSLIEVDKNVQAMKKFERLIQTKIEFTYTEK
jgi:hypothetical protein